MLIEEIVVRVENDGLDLVIRWAGDDHTALRVRKNRAGQHRWSVDTDVVELVKALARQMPDMAIAAVLNRTGSDATQEQVLDALACRFAAPSSRHRSLSRRRTRRTRRGDARRGG